MLDPARRGTICTRAGLAVTAALFSAPALASAQTLPTVPLPSTPSISLPLSVPAAQPCAGAQRRSGARARRFAIGCLVNRARTSHGLRGFSWNRRLARAAHRDARDMARRRYFAHRRPGGPSLGRRARAAGLRGRNVGEAIAYGCGSFSTPASIVRAWLASPGHRAILLSRRSRVGIGVAGRPPVNCGGRGATFVLDAG
jgi:uncharacterized protein YkwD